MAWTEAQKENLNNSMSAAQDVSLGTLLGQAMGSHVATADEATANAVVIDSGLSSITGFMVQIFRSDVDVTADAIITASGGNLTVADGGVTYAVTAGDVINHIIY